MFLVLQCNDNHFSVYNCSPPVLFYQDTNCTTAFCACSWWITPFNSLWYFPFMIIYRFHYCLFIYLLIYFYIIHFLALTTGHSHMLLNTRSSNCYFIITYFFLPEYNINISPKLFSVSSLSLRNKKSSLISLTGSPRNTSALSQWQWNTLKLSLPFSQGF